MRRGADAELLVDHPLRRARGDVAGDEVAERGVAALEEVVALVLGDLVGRALAAVQRDPDAPVVAQRLAHERQLALEALRLRDAGRVDLREARVRERRALPVRAPDRRRVGVAGVRREEEDVGVAARGEHDRVRGVGADLAGEQVARDDPARVAVGDDDVEELRAGVHRHRAGVDLPRERLVGAEQQLLAGLPARVERPRHLGAAEGAVVEQAAVLARERHALRGALVDDVVRDLREPVDVRLARAVVAALDRVVEEPVDGLSPSLR